MFSPSLDVLLGLVTIYIKVASRLVWKNYIYFGGFLKKRKKGEVWVTMKLKRCLLLRRECRPLQLHILFFCAANVAHALHHVPSVNHFLRTNPPPVSPRSWQHVVQFSTSTGAGTDDAAVNEDEKARIKAEREARKAAKEAQKQSEEDEE